MNIRNFERFQMSGPMYIYVSKETHKIHAVEISDGNIRLVKNMGAEAHILIKGLLLTALHFNRGEFYALMEYVDKYEDPYINDAILALRECTHNAKFDAAIEICID